MVKPIDALTRAELAAEFRAVMAEARRRGIDPDANLITDWYALRQQQQDDENHRRDLASEHFDLSWRDRDDG